MPLPLDCGESITVVGRLAFGAPASVKGNEELGICIPRGGGVICPFESILKHLRIPVSKARTEGDITF